MVLRFEDMLERLGSQGRDAVLSTYQLYEAGLIDSDTFIDVASELLQHINERSAVFGQTSYAQVRAILLDTATELPATATATASTSSGGLAQSLQTIIEGAPEQVVGRLERLGYVLPIESTQESYSAALQADGMVEGWQRGLNDDACQLCRWWSREGRIWPKVQPFQTHKGCKCQQVPKVASEDDVPVTELERKIKRREEAIANRDRRSAEVRQLIQAGEI